MAKSRRGVEEREKLSLSGFWVWKSQASGGPKRIHGTEKRSGEKHSEKESRSKQLLWLSPAGLDWVRRVSEGRRRSFPWLANQNADWLRRWHGQRKRARCKGPGSGGTETVAPWMAVPSCNNTSQPQLVGGSCSVDIWPSYQIFPFFFPQENPKSEFLCGSSLLKKKVRAY